MHQEASIYFQTILKTLFPIKKSDFRIHLKLELCTITNS